MCQLFVVDIRNQWKHQKWKISHYNLHYTTASPSWLNIYIIKNLNTMDTVDQETSGLSVQARTDPPPQRPNDQTPNKGHIKSVHAIPILGLTFLMCVCVLTSGTCVQMQVFVGLHHIGPHISHWTFLLTALHKVNRPPLFPGSEVFVCCRTEFISVELSSCSTDCEPWCVCAPFKGLMSVWLTSSLARISIKAPADEAAADGRCVLRCFVCQVLVNYKDGTLCFPAGTTLARCVSGIYPSLC